MGFACLGGADGVDLVMQLLHHISAIVQHPGKAAGTASHTARSAILCLGSTLRIGLQSIIKI